MDLPSIVDSAGVVATAVMAEVSARPVDSAVVMVIAAFMSAASRMSSLTMIVFNLPGTIIHESSHFITALILGNSPSSISIVPKRQEGGWMLGHIEFNATPFTTSLIALAPPLMMLPLGLLLWKFCMNGMPIYQYLASAYCIASCFFSGLPSGQDWKVAFNNPLGLPLVAVIGWVEFLLI